jgi:tripartite-type tricarboxylate transporter receptor subunit TctC
VAVGGKNVKKPNLTRRKFMGAAGALALGTLAAPSLVRASSYARQPVRLFVGTVAVPLERMLGQPVLVENRPGGATTMAVGLVANARPDGHTLLVSSAAAIATHVASATKPASLVDDLSHVGMICDGAFIYAVNKDVPASSAEELVAYMKKNPDLVRYGATGTGGGIHLSGALFQQMTGTRMTVIQYSNAGMRLTDLISNQTQLGIAGATVLSQQIEAGMLRPLFVAGMRREPLFPDVPTGAEAGIAGLEDISNWFGLHGPKEMPAQISADLNGMIQQAMRDEKVIEGLAASGFFSVPGKPEDLVARMNKDVEVMTRVVNTAGIVIQ